MFLDNVVFCDYFEKEITYLVEKDYKYSSIALIVEHDDSLNYKEKIEEILKTSALIKLIVLENETINNIVNVGLLKTQLCENLGLVVCLGTRHIVDLVKTVCTSLNVSYVLVPTQVSGGFNLNHSHYYCDNIIKKIKTTKPLMVLVEKEVVFKSSNKAVANCYGQIMSNYITVLDLALIKGVNESDVDIEQLKSLEKIVKSCSLIPNNVIKSKSGKMEVFNNLLKCESLVNEINYNYSSCEVVAMVMQKLIGEELNYGEILMVVSVFLVKIYDILINIYSLNENHLPSIVMRQKKLSAVFETKDYDFISKIATQNQKFKQAVRFNGFKGVAKNISQSYCEILKNSFNTFKNFYNDKCVSFSKIINYNVIVHSICLGVDIYNKSNFLTFMRDFGLLELY